MGSARTDARKGGSTTGLVAAVLTLTLVVLTLGGAVVAVKLRGDAAPPRTVEEARLEQLERAVAADPEDDVARTALGIAYVEAGKTDRAIAAFEEALRLNGDNWIAAYQLGMLLAERDPDRAAELLAGAAKGAPRMSKAGPLVALGDLQMRLGDAEAARDSYRRAVADVPYLLDAHLGLARALEALGDRTGALREYEQALRFDPQNPEIARAIERLGGQT
jgi:tetratricopeptide (TPR) repeat protein